MKFTDYKTKKWVQNDDPILIKEIDLKNGNTGWVVIDSMGYGLAAGGVRIGKNVNLQEIKLLAAEMSRKRLFYNDPVGGGKAGICCSTSLSKSEREEIFFDFGKSLKDILYEGHFYPGTDMGTNYKDIQLIYKGAGVKSKNNLKSIDSSYYTAISVFSSLKAIYSHQGKALHGSRIGIQGIGNVGLNILQIAFEHGIKLVAASTQYGALFSPEGLDINKIFTLANRYGDEFVRYYNGAKVIKLNEFFEIDMDIMSPCAGIYPINESNIEQIRAKIIVPGCNVAATKKIEKDLYERGITYLPGFVSNAGGVLGYKLKRYDIEPGFLSLGIESRVKDLLEQSNKSKRSAADIARRVVRRNQKEFALESKGKNRDIISRSVYQLNNYGLAEMLRKILRKLCERKLISPTFVRKYLLKKILFTQIFKSKPLL